MSCAITTTDAVVFGEYDTHADTASDTAGSVSYECSDVASTDRITISLGRSDNGSFFPRAMAYRGSHLEYNLFTDASRTRVWGDGAGGTAVYNVRPLDGRPVSVPIFARIPARQAVRVGHYQDTVTITILY